MKDSHELSNSSSEVNPGTLEQSRKPTGPLISIATNQNHSSLYETRSNLATSLQKMPTNSPIGQKSGPNLSGGSMTSVFRSFQLPHPSSGSALPRKGRLDLIQRSLPSESNIISRNHMKRRFSVTGSGISRRSFYRKLTEEKKKISPTAKSYSSPDKPINTTSNITLLTPGIPCPKINNRPDPDGVNPFTPPPKTWGTQPPSWETSTIIDTRKPPQIARLWSSEWYQNIDANSKIMRSQLEALRYLTTLIKNIMKTQDRTEQSIFVNRVRDEVHKMEFFPFLDGPIIKLSRVLEKGHGLRLLFDGTWAFKFPRDIRLDAQALFSRWMKGDIDHDLLRGIMVLKNGNAQKTCTSRSIWTEHPFLIPSNHIGQGSLHNGQWWPFQVCAIRDGAHGAIEAGIYGDLEKGAYSIVISNDEYANIDEGDKITYCGTRNKDHNPTFYTRCMLISSATHNEIRVLRSFRLSSKNKYRPTLGFRYDGLYKITGYEILDIDTAMYRFTLVRVNGQGSIRFEGAAKRPTPYEIQEYNKIRDITRLA
ncbi:MAG: hypothetical protein M1834_005676 [Cirrosporium novae-zelandiae]|nr:MAG: hypothetical protein M1834_005676 [Cirrosporium novae-zelandiae]